MHPYMALQIFADFQFHSRTDPNSNYDCFYILTAFDNIA